MRTAIGLAGLGVLGYGVLLLLDQGWPDLLAIGLWLGGGIALHDGLIAPLTIAATVALVRLVPLQARGAVLTGLVVLATVTLTAVPVLGSWGARPDNPTLLDRDYVGGWLVFAALVLVATLARIVVVLRRKEE